MNQASLVLCFMVCIIAAPSVQQNSRLEGTLLDQSKPFANGLVVLQRLDDKDCAKLFSKRNLSRKNIEKIQSCAHDLPETNTDKQGNYYERLEPGWYDIRFLWAMSEPPPRKHVACVVDSWALGYSAMRDQTGKYDGFAQGSPFELKAGEERRIDFSYNGQLSQGRGKCTSD